MEEKILVALDGSEHSWRTLDYAMSLAKRIGLDRITAVHSEVGGEKTELEEYQTGEEILEKAEGRGKEEGIEVETHLLVRGYDPDLDIVKFAEENDFNHIIVGDKGASGLSRTLLGSVAEGIIEKAHCATTVVRDVCPISD